MRSALCHPLAPHRRAPYRYAMSIRIASLQRYPVKGLSPEPLTQVTLTKGDYFPGDRLFAVENGPAGFDPDNPQHQPKIKFLMLMRNESLARLKTRYLDSITTLFIEQGGREVARGDLSTKEGRLAIEAFFRRFMSKELRGAPKLLTAPPGFRFTDSRRGFVSLINLASVRALENVVGSAVDPLRFRGNIHIDGLDPWSEFDLVGQVLTTPSGARLKVTKRIERCAATNVDPQTGIRDLQIPKSLMAAYGHFDCGIYAEVLDGGTLEIGEDLEAEQTMLAL
ncbi:MOSC domain-containing protein [Microvirga sp. Marseille-Q2068]|uniref:MOSC domain-containing protein n=2 Tax=Microvirga mediterraneensis TaxID=2754695 RepID=A0A838BJL3_9HYPH|nr:MOSC domain-containing protein [Microvirga mediterraneensis]MBA1154882.1 MOSC domain-containing protein [Microvirga mediterraneensis]